MPNAGWIDWHDELIEQFVTDPQAWIVSAQQMVEFGLAALEFANASQGPLNVPAVF